MSALKYSFNNKFIYQLCLLPRERREPTIYLLFAVLYSAFFRSLNTIIYNKLHSHIEHPPVKTTTQVIKPAPQTLFSPGGKRLPVMEPGVHQEGRSSIDVELPPWRLSFGCTSTEPPSSVAPPGEPPCWNAAHEKADNGLYNIYCLQLQSYLSLKMKWTYWVISCIIFLVMCSVLYYRYMYNVDRVYLCVHTGFTYMRYYSYTIFWERVEQWMMTLKFLWKDIGPYLIWTNKLRNC